MIKEIKVQPFGINTTNQNIILFDSCDRGYITYSGVDPKVPIIYNGEEWFLKRRREFSGTLLNNHLSEYIGSNVFRILGIDAQECLLGRYEGEDVVVIRNFVTEKGITLREFSDTNESSFDSSTDIKTPTNYHSFESVIEHIKYCNKQISPEVLEEYFWKLFVVDAIIGNFDRHGHNWGMIKLEKDTLKIAPVYDNGACLFSRLSDKDIIDIFHSEKEFKKRVYDIPKAKLLLKGKKVTYRELIETHLYPTLDKTIQQLVSNITQKDLLSEIFEMIQDIPQEICSNIRKDFYIAIIYLRYKCLLENTDFDVTYEIVREAIL